MPTSRTTRVAAAKRAAARDAAPPGVRTRARVARIQVPQSPEILTAAEVFDNQQHHTALETSDDALNEKKIQRQIEELEAKERRLRLLDRLHQLRAKNGRTSPAG